MTSTLRHHSPLGPIAIRGLRGLVEPDTDFEVPDHIAARLLEQDDVYELVAGDPRQREDQTVTQLRHDLAERGLPYKGEKRDALLERVLESDRVTPDVVLDAPEPGLPPVPPSADDDGKQETRGDVEQPGEDPADEPAGTPAPEPVDEPVDVVTDEPTTTEPATGQEGA